MEVTDEQVLKFEQDGFLILDRIIDATRVEQVLEGMNRVYRGVYNRDIRPEAARKPITPAGTERDVRWVVNARMVDADLWDAAIDAGLGQNAARLLRSPAVSIVEDQLLEKPGHGGPVNLHQDYSYWPFSTSVNMLTCWIALTDMTLEMGPLELARGSHRWGSVAPPRELTHGSTEEYLSAAQLVMPAGAEFEFVPAVVPSGGGVFFHGLTFHGSGGNSTDRVRRAISLHWASAECRLDWSKLLDYHHPYLFSGLRQGDRLTNEYNPQVYPI